jgi:hypothetical protein
LDVPQTYGSPRPITRTGIALPFLRGIFNNAMECAEGTQSRNLIFLENWLILIKLCIYIYIHNLISIAVLVVYIYIERGNEPMYNNNNNNNRFLIQIHC